MAPTRSRVLGEGGPAAQAESASQSGSTVAAARTAEPLKNERRSEVDINCSPFGNQRPAQVLRMPPHSCQQSCLSCICSLRSVGQRHETHGALPCLIWAVHEWAGDTMLELKLGSARRNCEGVTRRDVLRV